MKQFYVKCFLILFLSTFPFAGKAQSAAFAEKDSLLDRAAQMDSSGNYKMACLYFRQAIELNDSLSQLAYDDEVKALKSENQIDELYLNDKRENNRILVIAIICLTVLAAFFVAIFFYLKRRNKLFNTQMKELLEQKRESEESLMSKNHDFSKLIHDINAPISTINSSESPSVIKENVEKLRKLITVIVLFLFCIPAFSQQYSEEMQTIIDSFNYYLLGYNIPKTREYLELIKKQSAKENLPEVLFRPWRATLTREATAGNMELVIEESKEMLSLAREIKSEIGVVSAYIALSDGYIYSGNYSKAKDILEDLLVTHEIHSKDFRPIYTRLYGCCTNLKDYENALIYLGKQKKLIDAEEEKDPSYFLIPSRRIENYLGFAKNYFILGDNEKAYQSLLGAQKYFSESIKGLNAIHYHSLWAKYYSSVGQWEQCFKEINLSLSLFTDNQPALRSDIQKQRAYYLQQSGDYKAALESMKRALSYDDSLSADFILRQDKVIKENYRWEMGLLQKAKNEHVINIITICFISLLFLIILFMVVRLFSINRSLKKSKLAAQSAAEKALDAERLKDKYISNVRKEMLSPVDKISSLAQENEISGIKKISSKLVYLLDKILDLTYLESGAMRFDVKEYDILSLCYDLLDLVKDYKDDRVEINFISSVDTQMIKMDYGRFMDYMLPALRLPADYKLSETIDFNLSYSETGEQVVLSLFATPLANVQFESQAQSIQNDINTLFFAHFGGTYTVSLSKLRPEITVVIPC